MRIRTSVSKILVWHYSYTPLVLAVDIFDFLNSDLFRATVMDVQVCVLACGYCHCSPFPKAMTKYCTPLQGATANHEPIPIESTDLIESTPGENWCFERWKIWQYTLLKPLSSPHSTHLWLHSPKIHVFYYLKLATLSKHQLPIIPS